MKTPNKESVALTRGRKKAGVRNEAAGDDLLDQDVRCRLLDVIQQAVVVIDRDLNVLYVNKAAERLSGWKAVEVLSRPVTEFISAPQDWLDARRRIFETGKPWSGEITVPRRDGTTFLAAVEGSVLLSETGEVIGLIVVASDITERRQAEEALRESEEKFSSVYASMVEGVAVYEMKYEATGRATDAFVIDVNPAYELLMGMTRDHVVGRESSEVYAAKLNADMFRMWRRVVSSGEPESMEAFWPVTGKHLSVTAFSLGGSRFANVFHDITEQKQAEEALRESEERLSSVYSSMAEGLLVGEAVYDDSGRIIDFIIDDLNPALQRGVGLATHDLVGRKTSEALGTLFAPYFDVCAEVVYSRRPHSFEFYWEPTQTYNRVILFSHGEHKAAALFEDITKRKRAEEALRESEERYRGLFNTMGEAFLLAEVIFDEHGKPVDHRCLDANRALEELSGLKREEMIGRLYSDIFPAGTPEAWAEPTLRALDGERVRFEWYSVATQHNSEVFLHSPRSGQIAAFIANIDERVKAEQALRRSEQRYGIIHDKAAFGIALSSFPEGRYVDVNDAFERMSGYTRDELLGKTSREVGLRLDDEARSQMRSSLEGGRPLRDLEISAVTKSGEERFFRISAEVVEIDGERYLLATNEDVTQRKRAEEALRESEERYRGLFNTMREAFVLAEVIFDERGNPIDHRCLDANPALEQFVGRKREDMVGHSFREFFKTKTLEGWADPTARALKGEPVQFEWCSARTGHKYEVFLHSPRTGQIAALIVNIDERVEAEQALRESEERLRRACEAGRIGLFEWNSQNDTAWANPEAEELLGVKADSLEKLATWMDRVHPDDFQQLKDLSQVIDEARAGEGAFQQDQEYRVVRPDGTVVWLENKNTVAAEDGGIVVRGAVLDITERKRMEDALQEGEDRLRRAVRSGRIGLFEWNISRNVGFWSREVLELFGYEADSPANSEQLLRRVHPDDREAAEAELAELVERGRAGERDISELHQYRVMHDDGTVHWLEARITIAVEGGNVVMLGAVRDITEQKQAEQEIAASQAKLRTLLDLLPVGVSVLDGERSILYSNPSLSRIVQMGPHRLAAGAHQDRQYVRPDGSELPPDEWASVQAAKKGKPVENVESGIKVENGETVWLSVSATPLPFDDWRIAIITQDVTERRRREEVLRQNAELLEHAPVFVRNLDDKIMLWNSGMEDMYGYSREEALARTGSELLKSEYPQPIEEARDALLRDGRWEGEIQRTRKDGTAVTVLALQKMHRDTTGRPAAVIEIDSDITGRKLAEEQLERLRSEFYGVISHELKTPLTVIKGSAAVGLSRQTRGDPDEMRELFGVINDQSDRLTEMVNNLLDMTRIEAGTFAVETHETDIGETVTDAVRSFQRTGYGHRIEVRLNRRLPRIEADRRRVVQVLSNLLNNAAKFSPSHLPITIRAGEHGDSVVISVRDRGTGIAPEKLPLLFKKYSQLSETSRGGTGLGLWIAASIIEAHGGRIWAESAGLNRGATFSFTLPRRGAAETEESVAAGSHGLSILAVDDEPSILRFVERFLTASGHRVATTTNPFEVRGLVEIEEPDVLLLDMKMPGKSGVEVLKEIREFSEVPVVIITATENEQEVARARSFKGVTWLPKPFAPDEMLDHVIAAGERSRRSRTVPT